MAKLSLNDTEKLLAFVVRSHVQLMGKSIDLARLGLDVPKGKDQEDRKFKQFERSMKSYEQNSRKVLAALLTATGLTEEVDPVALSKMK